MNSFKWLIALNIVVASFLGIVETETLPEILIHSEPMSKPVSEPEPQHQPDCTVSFKCHFSDDADTNLRMQTLLGPMGLPGLPGPDGVNGPEGVKGSRGYPGLDGIKGRKGQPGDIGFPGKAGPMAVSGDLGPKGDKGEKGSEGSIGPWGLPGRDGNKGKEGGKGERGYPGEKGVDGDRGRKGLEGLSGLSGMKGIPGRPGQNGWRDCKVAFTVEVPSEGPTILDSLKLIFTKTISNHGNAYSAKTGEFTAPYDGHYAFYITITTSDRALLFIYHNRKMLKYMGTSHARTETLVLDMRQGDTIFTKASKYLNGFEQPTTFSGICLWKH